MTRSFSQGCRTSTPARELDAGGALDRLADILKLSANDRIPLGLSRVVLDDTVSTLKKAGARDLFVVSNVADLPGAVRRGSAGRCHGGYLADREAPIGKSHAAWRSRRAGHDRVGNLLLIGGIGAIERVKSIKPAPRPELAAACDAVARSTAQDFTGAAHGKVRAASSKR